MADDFVIGLGSNLGDRAGQLARAITALDALPAVRLQALSCVFETDPIGPVQPRYLNAAARIGWERTAPQLLEALHAIEDAAGRTRELRWGPRVIDLDILWGARAHRDDRLVVPHPSLSERTFALAPLLEVAPELSPEYSTALNRLGGAPGRVGRFEHDRASGGWRCELAGQV